MEQKLLKDVKKGEFFTKKPIEEPKETQVFIKGKYSRRWGKYEAIHFSDVCCGLLDGETKVCTSFCGLLDGETKVYTGFTF